MYRAAKPFRGSRGAAGSLDGRGSPGSEVRRDVGRRPGSHPGGRRSPRPDAPGGQRRRGRGLGHGQDHRRSRAPGQRRHPPPGRPRDGHAAHLGRAHLDGAPLDGGRGPRPGRGELHREPGRHPHRHRARQGQDHRGARRPHPGGDRRGQGRDRRRLPGRVDDARHHHAGPRRLRHHRGRAGRRARRRRVRDLHRRRRRVHRRPAHRADGAQACAGLVRRDARDGGDRWARARAALGRVRAQPPREGARAVELHVGAGNLDHRGGRGDGRGRSDGAGDHLRGHARHRRGQGDDRARARPSRVSRR